MADLIARLEAAGEGSRELDAWIWWEFDRHTATRVYWNAATGKPTHLPDNWNDVRGGLGRKAVELNAPQFSVSLDAALTLIRDGRGQRPCIQIELYADGRGNCGITPTWTRDQDDEIWSRVCATPELAACKAALQYLAALKAREHSNG